MLPCVPYPHTSHKRYLSAPAKGGVVLSQVTWHVMGSLDIDCVKGRVWKNDGVTGSKKSCYQGVANKENECRPVVSIETPWSCQPRPGRMLLAGYLLSIQLFDAPDKLTCLINKHQSPLSGFLAFLTLTPSTAEIYSCLPEHTGK